MGIRKREVEDDEEEGGDERGGEAGLERSELWKLHHEEVVERPGNGILRQRKIGIGFSF